jgi:Ca2+-binding RTX toxin-like protein
MATMNSGLGGPAGYGENVFSSTSKYSGSNDDGNVEIDITSVFSGGINFFGTTYTEIYLSGNGLITFGDSFDNDNDDGFSVIDVPALAPFYSDLNVNQGGEIYWDFDTVNGKITITFDRVEPYNYTDGSINDDDGAANSFQIVLTDLGGGDMHVEYIYGDIKDAFVGGDHAIAGLTDGAGRIYELEGSGNDTFMESNYATNDFGEGDPAGAFSFNILNGTPDVFAVDGSSGNDSMGLGYVDLDGDFITTGNDIIYSGDGNDTVYGEGGADFIDGGSGRDFLFGGTGNDTLSGGADNDLVNGQDGDDFIEGGAGFDNLYGNAGNDTILGGTGADYIFGGTGADSLAGGEGADRFYLENNFGSDTIDGGDDNDTIDLDPVSGPITVTYTGGHAGTITDGTSTITFSDVESLILTDQGDQVDATADSAGAYIDAGAGNDTINYGSGATTILGGDGNDTIDADAANTAADFIDAGGGNDTVWAGGGDDTVLGGDGQDVLRGEAGNDSIDAGAGNDIVYGGDGNDTLYGGASGADLLDGGADDDTIVLGSGDTALGGDGDDLFVLYDSQGTGGSATIIGGEGDEGGPGQASDGDRIRLDWDGTGVVADNYAITAIGDEAGTIASGDTDVIFSQIEWIRTGSGDDTINISADSSGMQIQSGDGADNLTGGSGNDNLLGEGGNDTLAGGDGDDNLSGGDGSDTFIITDGFGNDTIIGGEGGTDSDTLDLGTVPSGVNIVMDGAESGTFSSGDNTSSFSEIENLRLSTGGDLFDGSAMTTGTSADGMDGDDSLIGGTENDTFFGGLGADTIAGGDGDDYIDGGDGDDFLTTGLGRDTLIGGAGNDTLMNSDGDDSLVGGEGDDLIIATGGNDTLEGGDGSDTLDGGNDNDSLEGGAGDDVLEGGSGDDYMDGGDDQDTFILRDGFGTDTVIGGEGGTDFDTIDLSALTVPVTVIFTGDEAGTISDGTNTITFSGIERIITTDGADYADGRGSEQGIVFDLGDGGDTLFGTFGSDSISGGEGNDWIDSWGATNDTVDGGRGNDTLEGGAGNDLIMGGEGNDQLIGWTGNDTLQGGSGNDTLQTDVGADLLQGGDDADTFIVNDDGADDTIVGGEGGTDDDTIDLSQLSVPVNVTYTGDEAGVITGGGETIPFTEIERLILTDQNDTVDAITNSVGAVFVDGGGGDDSIDGGVGSVSGDTLIGGAGNDTLRGWDGDDTLIGGDGNDMLTGDQGADSLDGGAGDDQLSSYGGAATLSGGDGSDLFSIFDSSVAFGGVPGIEGVVIDGGEGGTDLDVVSLASFASGATVIFTDDEDGTVTAGGETASFSNIEAFYGSNSDDYFDASATYSGFIGDTLGVTIYALDGNDTLLGGRGGDTLDGGAGADSIDGDYGDDSLAGGSDTDTISGGSGNDTIDGGDGADVLDGGIEGDTLTGGLGDDSLIGGDGDDVFTYAAGDGADTITDFNGGNTGTLDDGDITNNDFIDLSAFYDDIWELHADQADDGILNQSNEGVDGADYSDNDSFGSGSLTFASASADNSSFTSENTGVVCFATGTAIRTLRGETPVENLRPGELVATHDGGASKILWIGCTDVALRAGLVDPRRTPVRIKPCSASGARALLVSPQHCLLMTDQNGRPVLARARHLAEETSLASFARGRRAVTYWHLLLERHSVVISQGRPSESFYPGPNAIGMMEAPERTRLLQAVPALRTSPVETVYGPQALRVLTRSEVRKIARTHTFVFAPAHDLAMSAPTKNRSKFVIVASQTG